MLHMSGVFGNTEKEYNVKSVSPLLPLSWWLLCSRCCFCCFSPHSLPLDENTLQITEKDV